VLASPAEAEKLREGQKYSYLLIKDRDLRRLSTIPTDWIVASDSRGTKTWYMVEFNRLGVAKAD
jgi:hypothetical protein